MPLMDSPAGEQPSSYRMDLYGPGAEDILYLGGPTRSVIAGSGDDRIFVFKAPGLVVAESGADTVIFCSLGAPSTDRIVLADRGAPLLMPAPDPEQSSYAGIGFIDHQL